MTVNSQVQYVAPDGVFTVEGMKHFLAQDARIAALEAKLAALAAVTKPTGGATVDSEARTAVDAVIDAAG